jgi:hypothetical protein
VVNPRRVLAPPRYTLTLPQARFNRPRLQFLTRYKAALRRTGRRMRAQPQADPNADATPGSRRTSLWFFSPNCVHNSPVAAPAATNQNNSNA